MKWSLLQTIFLSLNFLTVFSANAEDFDDFLDYTPKVAIICGKLTKHIDVNSGDWVEDKNSTRLCSMDTKEILRYCKAVYPTHDIRNVVESNNRVTIDSTDVTPYRCLSGIFESDALLVPPKCRFQHMHRDSECQSHDDWKKRASDKCASEQKVLKYYGVMIPCDIGLFSGVEFVCCPDELDSEMATDSVEVVIKATSPSVLEGLKSEIAKFAKLAEGASVGCDRSQYHKRRDQLEEDHRLRVKNMVKHWEGAEKRYKLLKSSDEDQAATAIEGELENLKKSLDSFDEQAKVERAQLKEEHHQCTQIELNYQKHRALGDFVAALQEEPRDGKKILAAVQQYVKTCTRDRLHNLRYFEYIQKHYPGREEEARQSLQKHLKLINEQVNKTMLLLYKLPEVARQIHFDLPNWMPKLPALPTEKPTVGQSSSAKEPTDLPTVAKAAVKEAISTSKSVDDSAVDVHAEGTDEIQETTGKPQAQVLANESELDDEDLPENESENENENENDGVRGRGIFRKPQSSGTFAAVIGVSCGALVVMVIIAIAMALRRSRGTSDTKTVLVDADSDGANEKSHLVNMQENGYENPTYRFYDY